MQQRQLRLGDILDDYCPRERRLTNHVIVAMIGDEVKQTRCSTCDADHEYKHARVPRPRRKSEPAALYAQVLADASPKKVVHEMPTLDGSGTSEEESVHDSVVPAFGTDARDDSSLDGIDTHVEGDGDPAGGDASDSDGPAEEGPVHRPLIRAQLPRTEGQPPPTRPAPDFTIRQPTGRQNRFRPRQQRGGQPFQGNHSGGNTGHGNVRGGAPRPQGGRPQGGRPPLMSHLSKRQGQGSGRKRSK